MSEREGGRERERGGTLPTLVGKDVEHFVMYSIVIYTSFILLIISFALQKLFIFCGDFCDATVLNLFVLGDF